jgi:CHAT domain-containing protein
MLSLRRALPLIALSLACAPGEERDVARGVAEQQASASRAVPEPTRVATIDSLLAAGDSVYRRNADSAQRLWTLALDSARVTHDSVRIARALTGIGQVARQHGDYPTARRIGEQALAIKQRFGMTTELFRSYNTLGLLARDQERLGDATRLYGQALGVARRTGDSVNAAKARLNLGLLAVDRGSLSEAESTFTAVAASARSHRDSVTLGRALNNLALVQIKLGDALSAVATLDSARRLAAATSDSTLEVNARAQLATAYDALGAPQRAFALLDSAVVMARNGKRPSEEAEDLKLIADLFADAGDYQHALDFYGRSRAITSQLGQEEQLGNILRNEGRVLAALGNVALARRRTTEAIASHRRAGVAYPQIADHLVFSEIAALDSAWGSARAHVDSARRLAVTLRAPVAAISVAIGEGQLAAARRDWPTVLRALDTSTTRFEIAGAAAEGEAFALRARALAYTGNLPAAVAAGGRAVAMLERVRGQYASGELRTTYAASRSRAYADQVLLLLRMNRADEALQVADAARGRALLEHLVSARSEVSAARRSDLERETLLRRIDELVALLRGRELPPERERSGAVDMVSVELRDSLAKVRAEYEALLARSAATPDRLAFAPTVPDIQASLAPGEVVLEYLMTPERLIILAMSRQELRAYQVPESEASLAARVGLARAFLQRRDDGSSSAQRGVLRALYDVLLAPVAAEPAMRGASTVIVVPHGALAYLPWSALIDSSGHYAVERHAFRMMPTSASVATVRRAQAGRAAARGTVAAFAPFPDSLPATRDEVRSVSRIVRGAKTHTGRAATEARVRAALLEGNVVHLATHARLNPRNPLFSEIDLAAGSARAASDNGRLEVHELLAMRVNTPLVFLSGCETALGAAWQTRFDNGEDYTTLAQALLGAGARNVIATLWRIDDAGAADFARRFYAAWAGQGDVEATGPTTALARAQRQMIADPRFASPHYWAAYQISGFGDGRSPASAKP